MSQFLFTYDLKTEHRNPWKEFAMQAQAQGLLYVYLGRVRTTGALRLNRLPNTTLWGDFENEDAVIAAARRARSRASRVLGHPVKLEKYFVTRISHALLNSDLKKAPIAGLVGRSSFATCLNHQEQDDFFAY